MPLPPLMVIIGPTASGKTDLAVELSNEFNGEIVNADSRQVYKEINIASAKPKFENWKMSRTLNSNPQGMRYPTKAGKIGNYRSVPHHLFDIVKPDEEFNVTHFKKLALETIKEIHASGKLPFLVGGTGLWISAVVDNLEFPDVPPNLKLRKQLDQPLCHSRPVSRYGVNSGGNSGLRRAQALIDLVLERSEAESKGSGSQGFRPGMTNTTQQLYQQLIAKDPDAALFIDSKNRRRIIRALEVIEATGKPFSVLRARNSPLFRPLMLGITRPMKELEQRIEKRIKEQIKNGLEQEAHNLLSKYNPRLPSLSSISVREWKGYFDETHTLEETLQLIRLHNRQYAKRQMTWFKKDKRICWIKNKDEALDLINTFLHS